MKWMLRPVCWFKGHIWLNDNHYPIRGYFDEPYKDSYCSRCRLIAGGKL